MHNRSSSGVIVLTFLVGAHICFLMALWSPSYADESCEVFRFHLPNAKTMHLRDGPHEVYRYKTDKENKIESIWVHVSNAVLSKPFMVSDGLTLPQRSISQLPGKVKACLLRTPVKYAMKSPPLMKQLISFCDERIKCCFVIWCTTDGKKCVSAHAYWS